MEREPHLTSPWDYLFKQFNSDLFPDIYLPICLRGVRPAHRAVVLYNVRTRQLHRHEPLVTMQEWLLWTGITTFGLILVDGRLQLLLLLRAADAGHSASPRSSGSASAASRRMIEAYNEQLRRARFFSAAKYKHPEATVRPARKPRGGRANKRRR